MTTYIDAPFTSHEATYRCVVGNPIIVASANRNRRRITFDVDFASGRPGANNTAEGFWCLSLDGPPQFGSGAANGEVTLGPPALFPIGPVIFLYPFQYGPRLNVQQNGWPYRPTFSFPNTVWGVLFPLAGTDAPPYANATERMMLRVTEETYAF